MYEVIYNRIISNLLLWSSSAPNNVQKPQTVHIGNSNPLLNMNMIDSICMPFSMAKSNIIFGRFSLIKQVFVDYILHSSLQTQVQQPIQTQILNLKMYSTQHIMKVNGHK